MQARRTHICYHTKSHAFRLAVIIPVLWLVAPQLSASATDPLAASARDRVQFSVQVIEQVETDRAIGEMSAQFEAASAADAAERVNRLISWAMAEATRISDVEARTLGYRTTPIYRKQHVEGWRVRQSIILRSGDSNALSRLLSHLQSRLNLDAIRYEVSPDKRQRVESKLLGKVIEAFRARAESISTHMGRPGYDLIIMQLQSHRRGPPPVPRMANAMSMRAERSTVSPPVIAGDTETVTLQVNGTIQLRRAPP